MTQSVELLLDAEAEAAVVWEWQALHAAGMPSEVRSTPSPSHRPHLTLYAGSQISTDTDQELSRRVSGLSLAGQLGALMLFGPGRSGYVLVHALVGSLALLELQRDVARICGADDASYFAAGRWTPHVTVARRMAADQLPAALSALAPVGAVGLGLTLDRCRRWDGAAKREWML